jgi:hypothetical protein
VALAEHGIDSYYAAWLLAPVVPIMSAPALAALGALLGLLGPDRIREASRWPSP